MQPFKYFIHGILTGLLIAAILFFLGLSKNIITSGNNERISISEIINQDRESAITLAVKKVSPAVVGINVLKTKKEKLRTPFDNDPFFSNFFPPQFRSRIVPSMGSGFVFSPEGYIITNHHVIINAKRILVTTTEGREYEAEIIGSDERSDIAVLKIDAGDHLYTVPKSSSEVTIGEWVIAFGNPYGLFEYVNQPLITVGVVSGVNISFGYSPADRHFYERMIQTDASINPGNSGGPLANSKGEVIGMNTMIYSAKEGGSTGIGFAIPIMKVKDIAMTLIEKGYVDRDFYFGFAKLSNYHDQAGMIKGVFVEEIQEESPAGKAGFIEGDIIIAVDNVRINSFHDMGRALMEIRDYKVGDNVDFVVYRNGDYKRLNLILESFKIKQ